MFKKKHKLENSVIEEVKTTSVDKHPIRHALEYISESHKKQHYNYYWNLENSENSNLDGKKIYCTGSRRK